MVVKLYVEGGGDSKALRSECRKGFTKFITKAGLEKPPRIVASGSRSHAYKDYCIAIKEGKKALLLVDSEEPVEAAHQAGNPEDWQPWQHLGARQDDRWEKPDDGKDIDCHLMVQVMESWFLTDPDSLRSFFGADFRDAQLPARPVEEITKDNIYRALRTATAVCKPKGSYRKGEHSFKLLAEISPASVTGASKWAKRFVDTLKEVMDC